MGKMSQEEINVDLFDEIKRLQNENKMLEESRNTFLLDVDKYETSTHINSFMHELGVNKNGEILCLIKVHGIEHTIGITEKDVRSFLHVFQMHKMK